jgi:hypothetical protein
MNLSEFSRTEYLLPLPLTARASDRASGVEDVKIRGGLCAPYDADWLHIMCISDLCVQRAWQHASHSNKLLRRSLFVCLILRKQKTKTKNI